MTKRHSPYNRDGVIIAIDGPAGAGKSTIANALALELGYMYVDTGAMYRAIALAVKKKGIDESDQNQVAEILKEIDIVFQDGDSHQLVFLNDNDVTTEIRDPKLYRVLSVISSFKCVRDYLLNIQRSFSKQYSIVMEGRDIGTVVFPEANFKFFLTASPEVRARRRFLEFKHKGQERDEKIILQEIVERDEKDRTREIAPLRKAHDAIEIDSSAMNAEDVVHKMFDLVLNTNAK